MIISNVLNKHYEIRGDTILGIALLRASEVHIGIVPLIRVHRFCFAKVSAHELVQQDIVFYLNNRSTNHHSACVVGIETNIDEIFIREYVNESSNS